MRARLASSMSAKLLASQLLVVVAGAGTLLLVALSIGPGIFHHHIRDALGYVPPDVARHLDMAYNTATLISLGIAVGAAVLTAFILSAVLSARLVRPVRALAGAAQRIARGAHAARVPVRGTDELAQLAGAFNEMATSLERAEHIRRQLLADVAHELRNPLATVESYVEALSDGVLAADEENWSAIRAETTRLNRLVNDLQEVSRAEAHELDLHPVPATLAALVDDAVKAATPAYTSKGVTLNAELSPQSPTVEVDRERIAEVLGNLLANALRHTPSGGQVRVSTHAARSNRRDRDHRHRRRHRPRASRPHLRALLPRRPRPLTLKRRHRDRPGHRPRDRRSPQRDRHRIQRRHRAGRNVHDPTPDPAAQDSLRQVRTRHRLLFLSGALVTAGWVSSGCTPR